MSKLRHGRNLSGEPRLQRLAEVRDRTGLSRSEIYRRVSIGTFPAPVKLGRRSTAWDSRKISAWIEEVLESGGCDHG
jgi:prophage regulatory protein